MNISDNKYILRWAKKVRGIRLLGGKCSNCGSRDIFTLQFHHKSEKEIRDHLFENRWSLIEKELLKCVLLCASCHTELHFTNVHNGESVKDRLLLIKGVDGCQRCGYRGRSNASLHFHHTDASLKSFGVSDGNRLRVCKRWVATLAEIEKCEVLCACCHLRLSVKEARWKKFEKIIMQRVDGSREKQTKVNRSEILKLSESGMGVRRIARELGCTAPLVSIALKKMRQEKLGAVPCGSL